MKNGRLLPSPLLLPVLLRGLVLFVLLSSSLSFPPTPPFLALPLPLLVRVLSFWVLSIAPLPIPLLLLLLLSSLLLLL